MRSKNESDLREIIRASSVRILPGRYAVMKVNDLSTVTNFFHIAKDRNEITAVIEEQFVEQVDYSDIQKWFRLFEVAVSVPFFAVGFLAAISSAIARKNVNILIVSTFSKDYLLIREQHTRLAVDALREIGFTVIGIH